MSEREIGYVNRALQSGWISGTGSYVGEFEQLLASRLQVADVVAVCSGTSALELALRALGVGPGHEVILPALTFQATASVVLAVGATPVFADISPTSWTIDPHSAAGLITSRTRALLAVDLFGHPSDYDQLQGLGLPIIEDAAEAYGAEYKGRPVGSLGLVSAFSFHANKVVSTGEGGCVATDDSSLAEQVRLLNNHGINAQGSCWQVVPGYNRRMTNLTAAIGLGQLERSAELMAARRRVAIAYDTALRGLPITRRPVETWATESVWLYTAWSQRRNRILRSCHEAGIDARPIWPLLPDVPAFANPEYSRLPLPAARSVSRGGFWLPTWSGMPEDVLDRVVDAVRAGFLADTSPASLGRRASRRP